MDYVHKNVNFDNLGLNPNILKSLKKMGYIKPSPIQKKCIPYLLSGFDVLGMAQTGSGKTAAFALPFLNNINNKLKMPQILVLTPTRELAIQVSEAIVNFSMYIRNINIVALYGGQQYSTQLRILRSGPQIVVGTPGRLLDHLKRKTLNLSKIRSLVLDEADEMLKMGFIEDVKSILDQIPKNHQTALFSATIPESIRSIANKFMKNPQEIRIPFKEDEKPDIKQKYCMVYGRKFDALVRFLEIEKFDAVIVFVRTKNSTVEISESLEKQGYNSSALNGDMNQNLREKTLKKFKNGILDILIATDVAARGLDVERISFVINYDIPINVESYIHRIGRTGRAGRSGKSLLFVEIRERRLLRNIQRIMKTRILQVEIPSTEILSKCRLEKFIKKIKLYLESKDLEKYLVLLKKIYLKENLDIEMLAAALLKLSQKSRPLILQPDSFQKKVCNKKSNYMQNNRKTNMNIYSIEIGRKDKVAVRDILTTFSKELKIKNIGNIKLFNTYSIVELPKKIKEKILKKLSYIKIFNKNINIKLLPGYFFKKQNYSFSRKKNHLNRIYSFNHKKKY